MTNDRNWREAPGPWGAGANLYPAYLRYMEQARRAFLELLPNEACRAFLRQAHRPLGGEEFGACAARLAAEGGQGLERLEEALAAGFAAQPTDAERRLCAPYLGLTGTS